MKDWWIPQLADAKYAEQLRKDYPHNAEYSDDELLDFYCGGRKYVITWDHVGDAYGEYEKLADAYFEQQQRIQDLEADNVRTTD